MLAHSDEYWNLLRCPKTNLPLKLIDSEFLIADTSHQDQQYKYEIIEGKPVLTLDAIGSFIIVDAPNILLLVSDTF